MCAAQDDPPEVLQVLDPRGMSDEALVAAFAAARDRRDRAGAAAAWDPLVLRSADRIRAAVRAFRLPEAPAVGIPRDEQDDVVQDALLRVLRKLSLEGSSIGEFRAAVLTVTRYQCRDHLRATLARERHLAGRLQDTRPGADDEAGRFDAALGRLAGAAHARAESAREGVDLLRGLLPELDNENQRAVLALTMEGHSSKEIAARLGLTPANVDQLRKRGVDTLRKALGDDAP
jgi:RNA polymerase sigma factor (sigma-70 family)